MKKFVIFFVIIIIISAFVTATVIYAAYKPNNIILMYHSIQPIPLNDEKDLFVTPADLENQFRTIADFGLTTAFITDIGGNAVYITFDDGYEDNYTYALPLMMKYNVKATVFIITDLIGEKGYLNEDQIREMTASGLVSFQCHTASHTDLTLLGEDELYRELTESKDKLESITNQPVTAISYPYGKFNDKVIAAASQFYTVGVTTKGPNLFAGNKNMTLPRYGIPNLFDINHFKYIIA